MRASLPRPSTSWAGTIASAAREARASWISDQCGSEGSRPVAARASGVERVPPADRRLGVVGAGVDDQLLDVVLGPVRIAAAAAEAEEEHRHAGQAELEPQPLDGRRDHAEVLGDQLQRTELAARGVEDGCRRAPAASDPRGRCALSRASTSRRRSRESGRCGPDRPDRRPGAGARSTSDSRVPQRGPVVERVAPELPARAQRVGGSAGQGAALEQLRVRAGSALRGPT